MFRVELTPKSGRSSLELRLDVQTPGDYAKYEIVTIYTGTPLGVEGATPSLMALRKHERLSQALGRATAAFGHKLSSTPTAFDLWVAVNSKPVAREYDAKILEGAELAMQQPEDVLSAGTAS